MTQINKIPFHLPEGQKLLKESDALQTLLIRLFGKQKNSAFCGIQSSALLLSARHFGRLVPDDASLENCNLDSPPYLEENMFGFKETKAVVNEADVDVNGCTMEEIYKLLTQHGRKVQIYHADAVSLDDFRCQASKALSHKDSSWGVIVNYDEFDLQQDPVVHGHFSPLAAYHHATDRFLLLDTWHNTVDVWVKAEDLFHSMKTIDPDSQKYRGFIILEG